MELIPSYIRSVGVLSTLLILMVSSFGQLNSQFEPPDGRVIHGLGQYAGIFRDPAYSWQLVSEYQNAVNEVPVIYSTYAYLDPVLGQMDTTDLTDLVSNHGYPYILLIGYVLFDTSLFSGTINIQLENILNGSLDYSIVNMADRINEISGPVFFRPGFEFGLGNSGIHNDPDVGPTDFKNIWMHIYSIFQQENVTNVAWVWNTVNPHQFNYVNWYPGDSYVDWWGINYFSLNQINSGDGFLNDAAQHGKPVIICESNPIHNGGTTNPANWNDWFVPYFQKIGSSPHLKAFVYNSDPWDVPNPFVSWPDSRITSNAFIQNNYAQEMTDSVYIHMDEYLADPAIISLPGPIDFQATPSNNEIELSWQNPAFSGFQGTQINRRNDTFPQNHNDGMIVFNGMGTSYNDTNVVNNTTYYYAIFTYDSISNFSYPQYASATPQGPTGTKDADYVAESMWRALKNFPNPFNAATRISWSLSSPAQVSLEVFTVNGERIESLFTGPSEPGQHEITWVPKGLPSGIYFVRLTTEGLQSKKAIRNPGTAVLQLGERQHEVLKVFFLK